MSVIEITEKNVKAEIEESKIPVLLDLYANWCGPCMMMKPVIEELSVELKDKVKFCKTDVDTNESLAVKYMANSIPLFVLIVNGKEVARTLGYQPKKSILDFIEKNIK